jgi:hypothetical protein
MIRVITVSIVGCVLAGEHKRKDKKKCVEKLKLKAGEGIMSWAKNSGLVFVLVVR